MYSKIFSILLATTILLSAAYLTGIEQSRRQLKVDFIEVSKAKYGIFNVDVWKEKISEIVANKIDEFQFDPKNKQQLVKKIESFLSDGVDLLEASYKSKQYSSIKGFFQNAFTSGVELFDRIRDNIPSFAASIVEDLEKPETRAEIKKFIRLKINQYADETFSQIDYTSLNRILEDYQLDSIEDTKEALTDQLNAKTKNTQIFKIAIYLSSLGFVILLLSKRGGIKIVIISALIACLGLLFLGLFLPMIDIDARVSNFDLTVLGEHVVFENQVLYFKSKSILEVVGLMIAQGRIDIIIVGILVLSFSVLFPLAKLISSFRFLIWNSRKPSSIADFFVFKSGKWSMADVLVVAIFMAYIGFSSILSEQLGQLEKLSDSLRVLTTNRSELNTGFFMFFAFVCLSLVISDRINKHLKA